MEPVSLIVGAVLGALIVLVVLFALGYRKKKQMEKQMEVLFGEGQDLFAMLDNLGAAFALPGDEADEPTRRRPIKDVPQA